MKLLTALWLLAAAQDQDYKNLRLEIQPASKIFDASGKMTMRFYIENDGDQEARLPEPVNYADGLVIKDEAGKTVRDFVKLKDVKRDVKVDGRGFIGRTVDVSSALKLPEDAMGWYSFQWKFLDYTSNEVKVFVWRDVVVTFETTHGNFAIELYPHLAPITVRNFLKLCKEGFYNGLTFHRVIPGFMMQGGCPKGDGSGVSKYGTIKGEFSDLKHERGIVSMARSESPDSASCQFFICFAACPFLDGKYAAFGKVIEGLDTIQKIEKVKTDHGDSCGKCGAKLGAQPTRCCDRHHKDMPEEPVKINKVTIKERRK